MEQDISRLQEVIKEKDGVIDAKTKRIAELEQSGEFTIILSCPDIYSRHDDSPGRHPRA